MLTKCTSLLNYKLEPEKLLKEILPVDKIFITFLLQG